MYAFLNPESRGIFVYDDFLKASMQAFLANQRFLVCFDEDEPYVVELSTKAEGEDNEA